MPEIANLVAEFDSPAYSAEIVLHSHAAELPEQERSAALNPPAYYAAISSSVRRKAEWYPFTISAAAANGWGRSKMA